MKKSNFKYYQWKIGTINVLREQTDFWLNHTIKQVSKAGLEICAFQEFRRLGTGNLIEEVTDERGTKHSYEIHWSGNVRKRIEGVALAIKITKDITIKSVTMINSRIITATIDLKGCTIKIIACYATYRT